VVSDTKPEETSPSWLRFRATVEPKRSGTLMVRETRPTESTFTLSNVTPDQVTLFVRQKSISPEVEQALRRILEQKDRVSVLESSKEERDAQMKAIYDDQERIRENMKALKGSAEEKSLLQRYARQLDEQETKLDTLKKEIADLETKIAAAQAELDKMMLDLTMDVSL
jgi:chromosome segregation ATPase